jgi:hypothetical protein
LGKPRSPARRHFGICCAKCYSALTTHASHGAYTSSDYLSASGGCSACYPPPPAAPPAAPPAFSLSASGSVACDPGYEPITDQAECLAAAGNRVESKPLAPASNNAARAELPAGSFGLRVWAGRELLQEDAGSPYYKLGHCYVTTNSRYAEQPYLAYNLPNATVTSHGSFTTTYGDCGDTNGADAWTSNATSADTDLFDSYDGSAGQHVREECRADGWVVCRAAARRALSVAARGRARAKPRAAAQEPAHGALAAARVPTPNRTSGGRGRAGPREPRQLSAAQKTARELQMKLWMGPRMT